MKWLLKIIALSLMLQSFQCSENKVQVNPRSTIILTELIQKKQAIIKYIATFDCSETVGCGSIAFGSKACGGPKEYLLFPNSINSATLQEMVLEYNNLEAEYNVLTNAVSDCMFVQPPTNVGCVNGVCSVIN